MDTGHMINSHCGASLPAAQTTEISIDGRSNMFSFGEILAMARKEKNFKQKDVSALLMERYGMDVKAGSISHWEKGDSMPNAWQFLRLCEVYQINNINETFGVYDQANPLTQLNSAGMEKISINGLLRRSCLSTGSCPGSIWQLQPAPDNTWIRMPMR